MMNKSDYIQDLLKEMFPEKEFEMTVVEFFKKMNEESISIQDICECVEIIEET